MTLPSVEATGGRHKARKKTQQRRREEASIEILYRCLYTQLTPSVTALEAIIVQLMAKSLSGDRQAKRVLLRYQQNDMSRINPRIIVVGGLPKRGTTEGTVK